jgi:hypothetical protein
MRHALALLLLITVALSAQVMEDSQHYRDASTLYGLIVGQGYPCVVSIQPNNSGVPNYFVYFNRNLSGSGGLERFLNAVVATSMVSSTATWSSNALLVMFNDTWLTISTSDCRYLNNNYTHMTETQLENWILENVISAPNPNQ